MSLLLTSQDKKKNEMTVRTIFGVEEYLLDLETETSRCRLLADEEMLMTEAGLPKYAFVNVWEEEIFKLESC